MTTRNQQRWMELIESLNSDEFDYPCTWFEDANGEQSTLMANRTVAACHIPADARRMKVPGSIWVHGDEWIHCDLQNIYRRLSESAAYSVNLVDDALYIELSPESGI